MSDAEAAPLRVLVLALTAGDARLTSDILRGAGILTHRCADLAEMARELTRDSGALLLTEEVLLRDRRRDLLRALAAQPAWSDVPIFVLARRGQETRIPPDLLEALGNASLLERPIRIATLVSAVRGALRARRRQYELRDYLEERERIALALAQSEARYRAIGEAIPFGVWVTDAEGRFSYVSPAFLELVGLSLEEVRARGWHHVLPPAEREEAAARWAEAIEAGEMFDVQRHLVDARGQPRVVLVRGMPLRDSDGEITSWVGLNLDVTERWRMEDEMVRIGRLDSVALLAGGIAHDFNNILTAIVGNIALAQRKLGEAHPVADRLVSAEKACEQAQTLVRQLLTFAKGGAPVRRAVDLGSLLREATSFALQGSAATSEIVTPPDLWPIEADAGQIGQVVHNLVLNALQAMQGAGTVEVRAENVEVAPRSPLPLASGRYVAVYVTDRGVGIPAADLERIFDLFYTTKPGGSGLGLATTYSVVHRHGGHITVRSVLGVGTTFVFYVPASGAPVDVRPPGIGAAANRRGRILVMDDDAAVREIALETLTFLGYEVELTREGGEALQRFERACRAGQPFDLLLLDLTVAGGMGGRETLARLREAHPGVRAIVVSGYSNDPVMSDHAAYGFSAAIEKPYDIDRLGSVIAEVLGAS